MFNVSWSDPASETVAQRRERKERDERNSVQSSAGSSVRSFESNSSSKPQNTRFPAKTTIASTSKQTTTPKRGKSLLKDGKLPRTRSNPSLDASGTSPDSQQTIKAVNRNYPDEFSDHLRDSVADTLQSARLSNGRSNTTASSRSSVTDNTSKSYEVQALTEKSFITRSTETKTAPQDCTNILNQPMSKVSISVEVPIPDDYTIEIGTDKFQFPRVPGRSGLNEAEVNTALSRKKSETVSSMMRMPGEFWRPPIDWEYLPNDSNYSQHGGRPDDRISRTLSEQVHATSSSYSTHLQRHIRRMEAANPKIILERIKEEWTEVDDAVCKELEFEKHLWMLTGLKYLARRSVGKHETVGLLEKETAATLKVSSMTSKVLSLFENQASASFLAAFTTAVEIHHIATSPLPPCQIQHAPNKSLPSCSLPHVYPLTVPSPSLAGIPFGSNLFCSISSLSLPTILPSSSISPLLRKCYQILRPSGTLYLTIIDPLPLLETTGLRLRAWLEKHLMLNLEKHFRCLNPGRLLPAWLKEAGFSSQPTVIEFWAVEQEEGTHAELNSVIGKMLWKEMWGSFLEGEEWWWDDEAVMEECDEMETKWECFLVEAVKAC